MTILLIALMFIMTIYSVKQIVDRGRKIVTSTTTGEPMANVACIAITIITVAYDAACIYLLVKVV